MIFTATKPYDTGLGSWRVEVNVGRGVTISDETDSLSMTIPTFLWLWDMVMSAYEAEDMANG